MKDSAGINLKLAEETAAFKGRLNRRRQAKLGPIRAERLFDAGEEWERTFDAIPDLIMLLDQGHRIIRVNAALAMRLGRRPEQLEGRYCYEVVHGLDAPPDSCPHAQLLKSGKEQMGEVAEERLGGIFNISVTPLQNESGQLVGAVHVARDITLHKQAEKELAAYGCQLEALVKERTVELQMTNERLLREIAQQEEVSKSLREARSEVEEKAGSLEEMNAALNVLLKHREADRAKLAHNVMLSVRQLVTPYLEELKTTATNPREKMLIEMIEAGLKDITSPFTGKLSVAYMDLTPREIQVSNLIKAGKQTKEIANFLGVSPAAVNLHRNHLRAKLGLKNKKINLFTLLSSLPG